MAPVSADAKLSSVFAAVCVSLHEHDPGDRNTIACARSSQKPYGKRLKPKSLFHAKSLPMMARSGRSPHRVLMC
jgi:hypothetical protein